MSDEIKIASITRQPKPADDIITGLRNIATLLENGELDLFTTAVIVLGHTENKADATGTWERDYHETFVLGPRHDPYTVRGLLGTALTRFNHGE